MLEYCPCTNTPNLQHIGFWQHSSLNIDANYQCVYCKKYYKVVKGGKLKEIINFKGVTKNLINPTRREYRKQ